MAIGQGRTRVQAEIRVLERRVSYDRALTRSMFQLVPRMRGNWLVACPVFGLLPPAWRRARVTFSNGSKATEIFYDLADPSQFTMVKNNRFDLMTASVMSAILREGDTYVDVGANWGYFAALGSRAVGPTGLVVAVEPSRQALRRLLENVHRNRLSNVVPVNVAAYDRLGSQVTAVRSFYRQTTGTYVKLRDESDERGGILTATMDYVMEKFRSGPLRLVKIDTEGAELFILKGAAALLQRWRPMVILEAYARYTRRFGYPISELYDCMRRAGYSRAFTLTDEPPQHERLDPAQGSQEGQILFLHEDDDHDFQSRAAMAAPRA